LKNKIVNGELCRVILHPKNFDVEAKKQWITSVRKQKIRKVNRTPRATPLLRDFLNLQQKNMPLKIGNDRRNFIKLAPLETIIVLRLIRST